MKWADIFLEDFFLCCFTSNLSGWCVSSNFRVPSSGTRQKTSGEKKTSITITFRARASRSKTLARARAIVATTHPYTSCPFGWTLLAFLCECVAKAFNPSSRKSRVEHMVQTTLTTQRLCADESFGSATVAKCAFKQYQKYHYIYILYIPHTHTLLSWVQMHNWRPNPESKIIHSLSDDAHHVCVLF